MFAGAGIYRDGVFFALATSDGGLYLKCDAETEQRFRDAGAHPFIYGRDTRKVTMSYWSLPEEALDDPDALKVWADLAFQAALRAPPKKKRKREGDAKETDSRRPTKAARPARKHL
jgi:DNA transformation protein